MPIYAEGVELTDLLTSMLGVSSKQAEGGAGAVFELAKQKLSDENFKSVAKAVPGIDTLMNAAPKGSSGSLGVITSMLGSDSNTVGGLAALAGSFKELGLSSDMVGKFTPVILDYVKGKGGSDVMNILKGVLE